MPRIAIVAAMEREVEPLIRNWKARSVEHDGRKYMFFENGTTSLICAGIGPAAARRATEAIIRHGQPDRVLSVGFAGALDQTLRVGAIIEPRTVINAADGVRTDTGSGSGVLVSFSGVAGVEQKRKLHNSYGASVVDMEAAAVAQGAQARGITFGALKVVSDEAGQKLPPLDRFVDADGAFRSGRFALYVAFRPWLWGVAFSLARNSARARRALCSALERYVNCAVAEAVAARD